MQMISLRPPLTSQTSGMFISRGKGIHPDRTTDFYVLIFVRNGELKIQEERTVFTVRKNETLLLQPHRRHWGTEPYQQDLSFYWIHFNPASSSALKKLSIQQHSSPERPDLVTEYFRRYLNDQENGQHTSLAANMLGTLLLCEASRAKRSSPSSGNSPLAGQIDEYIAKHFHENIRTARIARALKLNPDYIERIFHKTYRVTITQSVHHRRIKDARALLRESDLNINQIARECGFSDTVYFRRIFKRHCGMTPFAYRKLNTRTYINTR
jgi:AraC-like DNA-binding protein